MWKRLPIRRTYLLWAGGMLVIIIVVARLLWRLPADVVTTNNLVDAPDLYRDRFVEIRGAYWGQFWNQCDDGRVVGPDPGNRLSSPGEALIIVDADADHSFTGFFTDGPLPTRVTVRGWFRRYDGPAGCEYEGFPQYNRTEWKTIWYFVATEAERFD